MNGKILLVYIMIMVGTTVAYDYNFRCGDPYFVCGSVNGTCYAEGYGMYLQGNIIYLRYPGSYGIDFDGYVNSNCGGLNVSASGINVSNTHIGSWGGGASYPSTIWLNGNNNFQFGNLYVGTSGRTNDGGYVQVHDSTDFTSNNANPDCFLGCGGCGSSTFVNVHGLNINNHAGIISIENSSNVVIDKVPSSALCSWDNDITATNTDTISISNTYLGRGVQWGYHSEGIFTNSDDITMQNVSGIGRITNSSLVNIDDSALNILELNSAPTHLQNITGTTISFTNSDDSLIINSTIGSLSIVESDTFEISGTTISSLTLINSSGNNIQNSDIYNSYLTNSNQNIFDKSLTQHQEIQIQNQTGYYMIETLINSSDNTFSNLYITNPCNNFGGWENCWYYGCWRKTSASLDGNSLGNIFSNNTIVNTCPGGPNGQYFFELAAGASGNYLHDNIFNISDVLIRSYNPDNYNVVDKNGYKKTMEGTKNISGNVPARFGMFFGGYGSDYPYNTTTSSGDLFNVTDYNPITSIQTPSSPTGLIVEITSPINGEVIQGYTVITSYSIRNGTNPRNCQLIIGPAGQGWYPISKNIDCIDGTSMDTIAGVSYGLMDIYVIARDDGGAQWDNITVRLSDQPLCDDGFILCPDGICKESCGSDGPPINPPIICVDCAYSPPATCLPGYNCPTDIGLSNITINSTIETIIISNETINKKADNIIEKIAIEGSIQSIPSIKLLLKSFIKILLYLNDFLKLNVLSFKLWQLIAAFTILYGGYKSMDKMTAISTASVIFGIILIMTYGVFRL